MSWDGRDGCEIWFGVGGDDRDGTNVWNVVRWDGRVRVGCELWGGIDEKIYGVTHLCLGGDS